MRPLAVLIVAAAAVQVCFGAGASAREPLHFQLHALDLNIHGVFGTPSEHDADGDVLFHAAPADANQHRGVVSPRLDFGSFQAGIENGRYDFDSKSFRATSVHGDVGRRSTKLMFTIPIR
jgi:hypothetical protein